MSTTTDLGAGLWCATADVVPLAGNSLLGEATGAYVAVVGLAASKLEFQVRIERAMRALDFALTDLEDVRQLDLASEISALDEVMRDRVAMLHTANPVELGSFHAYTL